MSYAGVILPKDLMHAIESQEVLGILCTFSSQGLPNSSPINCIYTKGNEGLLFTISKDSVSYKNLTWQKRIMITFLGKGNIAYSVGGRSNILRAPSLMHPTMNIVRVDVVSIKDDRWELAEIDKGIGLRYTSIEAEYLHTVLMDELKELSETL